jgi:selenide,water dikinase
MRSRNQARKPERDIVLIGGGHAHALVLRQWSMNPPEGVRVTLISDASESPYSGMLPGVIAGHYTPEMIHIDLRRLCDLAGARFIQARVTGLDVLGRSVMLDGRPAVAFDRASVNIGATPDLSVTGASDYVTPVKPIAQFWSTWARIQAELSDTSARQVSVVGGGAGGVEVVMAMAYRMRTLGQSHRFQLVTAGPEPLPEAPRRLQQALAIQLKALGVRVLTNFRVAEVGGCFLRSASGEQVASDYTVWCTQSRTQSWLSETGLPCTDEGFLRVDANLQTLGSANIFAAGDCAWQDPSPSPRAGVYAVRQAPVLADNLLRSLKHESLRPYRPQTHFLSLLACGEPYALGRRGKLTVKGGWVWQLKDRIDRRFMAMFPTRSTAHPQAAAKDGSDAGESMLQCGGCAAKLGSGVLRQALSDTPGGYAPEDASILAIKASDPAGTALIQSIDGVRPLVSDPWLMGRLATIHALSDLAAMGCAPHSAQCLAVLPSMGARLQARDLQQMLAGIRCELQAVGAVLAGGHSMESDAALLGITVNGFAQPDSLIRKQGAQVGDRLCLTKPLGIGVLFAAAMRGMAKAEWLESALASMLVHNARAAALCHQLPVSALTDVTGFGVLGHVLEILGHRLDAHISATMLPALPGAMACLEAGIESSLAPSNRESMCQLVSTAEATAGQTALLFDPQTCGGLLIAVAPAQLVKLRELFAEAELPLFEIGCLTEGDGRVRFAL